MMYWMKSTMFEVSCSLTIDYRADLTKYMDCSRPTIKFPFDFYNSTTARIFLKKRRDPSFYFLVLK